MDIKKIYVNFINRYLSHTKNSILSDFLICIVVCMIPFIYALENPLSGYNTRWADTILRTWGTELPGIFVYGISNVFKFLHLFTSLLVVAIWAMVSLSNGIKMRLFRFYLFSFSYWLLGMRIIAWYTGLSFSTRLDQYPMTVYTLVKFMIISPFRAMTRFYPSHSLPIEYFFPAMLLAIIFISGIIGSIIAWLYDRMKEERR